MGENKKNGYLCCKGLIVFFLFIVALVFGFFAETKSSVKVYAAESDIQKRRIIEFTDDSGKYLEKVNNDWFLRDWSQEALTGVQYVTVPKTADFQTGYYMFDGKGKLVQKISVYYFKEQTIGNVVFKGYHCTNSEGRFFSLPQGLVYLKNLTCNGKQFNGIFYMEEYGRISASAQMRKVAKEKVGGISIASGYYYFNAYGQLCTTPGFHYLKQKLVGKTFMGNYYFGGENGALYRKAGWVTFKNKKYYLSSSGRRYENCWKGGYYLLEDGTIAKNQKVPDGSYVDCDGKKCAKSEMVLSGLKKQLKTMTDSYSGTWSVYVKNLKTGDVLNLNEQTMYPASVIKPFVMAATFERIKNKKLSYNSTVKSLLKSMITVSDNEAYNQLVRMNSSSGSFVQGATEVNAYLKKYGYTRTGCHTTLHPSSSAYTSDGGSNTSSAKDCGVLLEKIYKGTCVSAAYSKEMLNLLLGQTRRWKIPAGLPAGTKVANKTGETSSYQHDMAIVYGPKTTYVICVFSGNVSSYSGIVNISRCVYEYLN